MARHYPVRMRSGHLIQGFLSPCPPLPTRPMHDHFQPRGARRRLLSAGLLAVAAVPLAPAAAAAAPAATLTPATAVDAANRQVGAGPGTARTYTVTSTSTDPLAVTGVTLTGSERTSSRSRRTPARRTAPAPARARGDVRGARGLGPGRDGVATAALQIAADGPTLTSAALSGTGRDLAVSPAAHDFGRMLGGGPWDPATITITNEAAEPYALLGRRPRAPASA